MKSIVCRYLLSLFLLWLPSAAAGGGEVGTPFSDPDRPVTVSPGDSFTIVLPANRSTGYGWQLAKPLDEMLRLVGSDYQSSSSSRDGAGGREVWRFVARQAGNSTIVLDYVRPWEQNRTAAKRAAFRVIVQ